MASSSAISLVGCNAALGTAELPISSIFGYVVGCTGVRVGRKFTEKFEQLCVAKGKNDGDRALHAAADLDGRFKRFLSLKEKNQIAHNQSAEKVNKEVRVSADGSSYFPGLADLLVVGPGLVGSLVAKEWIKVNDGQCNVVGQTNTTKRHEQLRSIGVIPVTKDAHKGEKFPNVIFCAPPSENEDYAAEVRAAAERWNGEGSLLFTSSSAVYAVNDNGLCDEGTAPLVPRGASPRTDRLYRAEEEVLKVGGNVVRLAGLYVLDRGAHSYYLSQGRVAQRGDHILNLIHCEDAASLCVTILRGEFRSRVFVGCDNHPITRQEIMDAVNKSGKFYKKFEGFTTTEGPLGKKMNNDLTRRATGWKPNYESFQSFLDVDSS
ncbi:hypothetical protein R1flu_018540 [Riccia fluitans]|uniref:Uncharacterized protein n=1 Tax=Riccia fluitans TaxID=41844 RepID=A0ABD1ZGB6_9MARC